VLSLVRASDDSDAGRLRVSFGPDLPDFVHHYDPLTGVPCSLADGVPDEAAPVPRSQRRTAVAN